MKILFVVSKSVEVNTSASIRNSAVMSGLMELGHSVTLVSTMPDKKSEYYDDSLLPEGTKVIYLDNGSSQKIVDWLKRNTLLKPLKRVVSKHKSATEIYDSQKWIINHISEVNFDDYDCIISSSDPKSSHLFVYEGMIKSAERFGERKKKWIQIWGDPFLGDVSIANIQGRDEIYNEEKKLVAVADLVYYVSTATLEAQKKNYPESADKMKHIPIPYLRKRIFKLRDLQTAKSIELCYCGDYPSSYRDIRPLYDAVNSMDGTHLTICGTSDVKLNETDKVTIMPRQEHRKIEEIEEKADILVHLSNSSGTQIPGKIYQYSGTNKPILFILDGEKEKTCSMFEKYNRFVFTENCVESIKNSIREIRSRANKWVPVNDFDKKRIANLLDLG
jgi:hypothetical protein